MTALCPDIDGHNVTSKSVSLLELTCPLDSTQHLKAARDCEQEHIQLLSELDRLRISSIYDS